MALEQPDVEEGIEYWKSQPASYDGVLGGYGTGTLPRIDALGSRLFLLNLYPELSTVPSAFRPPDLPQSTPTRTRALDVGAGVGRVTADVLLHLVSDVTLVEPVDAFVQEALVRARASAASPSPTAKVSWPGLSDGSKSVTILQETLQNLHPQTPHRAKFLDRVGYQPPRPQDDIGRGFDVIWCQWCLGHLTNPDLIAFLQRSRLSLNDYPRSLIVVKENICSDGDDGSAEEVFDEQDSSLTRSDAAWKVLFDHAGLRLVREQVQEGLPEGLYVVKMYALR